MKVLLLYPNLYGMNMLPSAIGLFTSLLRMHNHEVALFDSTNWKIPGEGDFNSDKEKEKLLNVRPFEDAKLSADIRHSNVFEDFKEKVESFKPDIIAVSVSEDIFPIGISLLSHVRCLKIPTVMGGVFPTFAPELCLSYDEVDMICVGEGEKALVELCARIENGEPYDNIENLWIKKGTRILKNPIGPPTDINENPLIDFGLFDESRFYRPMQGKVWRMLPVETHRGCPYRCTYCNSPSQFDLYRAGNGAGYYRKKSFDVIKDELVYYRDILKAESFYFWADTLMAYNDREFDRFVEMYSDIKLPFWCQIYPELIKEERVKKLMSVGLFRVGSGVEHGNENFRTKLLKRRVKNKLMIENFKILNKCDLPFSVNNIIGFPTETRELAMDTVEINRHINADSYNAYSYSPFHGTPLRRMSEELGYIERSVIARSATKPTLLKMRQFPPGSIEGLRRCFVLYVKMPKEKWPEIEKAEMLTPEGDAIWDELRQECNEEYMNYHEQHI